MKSKRALFRSMLSLTLGAILLGNSSKPIAKKQFELTYYDIREQLIDKLPVSDKRKEVKQDLLDLKLSKTDYHFITLKDKYKDEE